MNHEIVELFASGRAAVLTGAGVSTDSGIPDYRGTGGRQQRDAAPSRIPMRIDQFMRDEAYRRRFWAGARMGAVRAADVAPNAGHLALARLERAGRINGVITQNVDDLHRQAGSQTVVELHGNGSIIRCIDCGLTESRREVLARFDELNPGFIDSQPDAAVAPDGDARVSNVDAVRIPTCPNCGGILRPDVVYFGEIVPPPVFAAAERLVEDAALLLVAGSSLAVNTGMRLVHRAERRGLPIVVINRGPTQLDERPSLTRRIEAGTSETLTALADALGA